MNDFLSVYLIISGIMMLWALSMCVNIFLSEESISFGEVSAIVILIGLFWWMLVIAGFAYMVSSDRKRYSKRKHI